MATSGSTRASDALLARLKRIRPNIVRVHLADGESKDIAVGANRAKWAPAVKLCSKLAWVRIELLDAKERLLDSLDNDAPAQDVEDINQQPGRAAEVRAMLALMLNAQDVALQRHTEALKPTLDATRTMIRDLTEAATTSRREATKALEQAGELADRLDAVIAARAAGDEEGAMSELKTVMELIPMVRMLVGGPPRAGVRPAGHPSSGVRPTGQPGSNGVKGAA